jgi:PEP-CTERM motif
MKLRTLAAIVALAPAGVVVGATGSKADVTYIVSGTFDDSTTLSGEFTVDIYGYVELSSLFLTTSNGTITGYVYTSATADPDGCGANCVGYGRTSPPYFGGLQLTFMNPLGSSAPDPIVGGEGGPSWENLSYTIGGPPIRYLANGVATPVPEPATWAMMLLGFASLSFAGYRAQRRTAAAAV